MGAADGLGDRRHARADDRSRQPRDSRNQTSLHAQTNRRARRPAILAASALLSASAPTFWTVSTQADFLKGDVENLSIDSDGRVFLGPATTQVAETSAPFLWTVLAGADGTLWAGTGNEGQVLKIAPRRPDVDLLRRAEMEVHALAPAPGGGLYVATSPDGKIYQVAADGTSKTFFDPDDKYIWALAVARRRRALRRHR